MENVTEKQLNFITTLASERSITGTDATLVTVVESLTKSQASGLITRLLAAPLATVAPVKVPVGMYRGSNGDILRVYFGQQSGQNLVKRVVRTGTGEYRFEYVSSATKVVMGRSKLGKITLERMTLEEAKAWGRMTNSCVACGRRLDDPESVEAGIGPVCAKKF